MKPLSDGAKAVVIFNKTNSTANIKLNRSDIGMQGKLKVRDLWEHASKGSFKKHFSADVPPHGVVMIKVSQR